jgi:autotransporter-associated beta strand protein
MVKIKNIAQMSLAALMALESVDLKAASHDLTWTGLGEGNNLWSSHDVFGSYYNWDPVTSLSDTDVLNLTFDSDFSTHNSAFDAYSLGDVDISGLTFTANAKGTVYENPYGVPFTYELGHVELAGDVVNHSTAGVIWTVPTRVQANTSRTVTNNGANFKFGSYNDRVDELFSGITYVNAANALQSGGAGMDVIGVIDGGYSNLVHAGSVAFISNDVDNGSNLASYLEVSAAITLKRTLGYNAVHLESAGYGTSVRLTGVGSTYTSYTQVAANSLVFANESNSFGAYGHSLVHGYGNETYLAEGASVRFRGVGTTPTYTVHEEFFLTGNGANIQIVDGAQNTNVTMAGDIFFTAAGSIGAGVSGATMNITSGIFSHDVNTITFLTGAGGSAGVTNINTTITGTTGNVIFNNAGTANLNGDLTTTGVTDLRGGVTVNTTDLIDNVIAGGGINSFSGTLNLNSNNAIGGFLQQGNATVGGAVADINIAVNKVLTMGGNYIYNERTDDTVNTVATIDGGTLELGANRNFTIADDQELAGAESRISSVIAGDFALNKLGNGTLALNAFNTYTGSTTVGAGALDVNGSLVGDVSTTGASILNIDGTVQGNVTAVAANSALRVEGSGIVEGNVTLASAGGIISGTGTLGNSASDSVIISAGALNPGGSSLGLVNNFTTNGAAAVAASGNQEGTLVVNGDLTTTGTGVINIQLNAGDGTADKITGIDALSLANDSVVLSNIGGSFVDGQVYDLFDFTSLSIPSGSAIEAINASGTGVTQESLVELGMDNGIFANQTAYWDYSSFASTGSITYRIVPGLMTMVPEPSKAIFLGFGAAVMLLRRRRQSIAA